MLTFQFSGSYGLMTEPEILTAGMVGKQAVLELSADWEGLTKTVVFSNGLVSVDVICTGRTVTIPARVLEKPLRTLTVGLYGVSSDGKLVIPTIRAEGPGILPGVEPSGGRDAEPDLPIWAQLQGIIGPVEELETENRENLVAAINEAAKSSGSGGSGKNGATFLPSVSEDGTLSWTNNGGLKNPDPVNLKGPKGDAGANGKSAYAYARQGGYTGTEAEFALDLARDIPEALPNPHPLTITGAVQAVYDGSQPVRVEIPTGGTSGGGGESSWEKLVDMEVTQEVEWLDIDDFDKSKQEYAVRIYVPVTETQIKSGYSFFFEQRAVRPQNHFSSTTGPILHSIYVKKISQTEAMFISDHVEASLGFDDQWDHTRYGKIAFGGYAATTYGLSIKNKVPAGTIIRIYGK